MKVLLVLSYLPLALYLAVIGWAALYAVPLVTWRVLRGIYDAHPPPHKALGVLLVGLTICGLVVFYLSDVPLGAVPCGPRLPCPPSAEYVTFSTSALSFLFRAAGIALIFEFGVFLILAGLRSLVIRRAA
jgi:hypothetical protein